MKIRFFDKNSKNFLITNDISEAFISFDIVHVKKEARLIINSFSKKNS